MEVPKDTMSSLLYKQPTKTETSQSPSPKVTNTDVAPRFTQDSPVFPEVWKEYEEKGTERIDLILIPFHGVPATVLLKRLKDELIKLSGKDLMKEWDLSTTGDSVAVKLTFKELILATLPLTKWWKKYLWTEEGNEKSEFEWLKSIIKSFSVKFKQDEIIIVNDELLRISSPLLWSISLNRRAFACLYESVPITKADAARRLFDIDTSEITWAVLDTGIDAKHIGFRAVDSQGKTYDEPLLSKSKPKPNQTRIIQAYDFTKFRSLISVIFRSDNEIAAVDDREKLIKALAGYTSEDTNAQMGEVEINELINSINTVLKTGRMLDWTIISPFLRIPLNEKDYKNKVPLHPHGTHVAGILGGNDLREKDSKRRLVGMCPNINLYDIRVLDENGEGDEFNILAALQFVSWLNSQAENIIIHGINLSLSMIHDVENFAAGRTPVCEACQRLVNDGTVVVTAAGNLGQSIFQNAKGSGSTGGLRTGGITDPGNAECVITVGATHRSKPQTYGVSYFSSKGPTGDGRYKPDLVAPGEKIYSLIPNDKTERMDGSSMAAPHVSGAAALLLATHKELIGQPLKVKEILCKTATDLGRERYFQGHGMLDVLRALQCV
jgi:serine protease AprX